MKKKVLITGASGFVGYHLIATAIKSDLDVYAAVRPSSDISHLNKFDIQYINLDFSDTAMIQKDIEDKKYNYIIHAAGITKAKTAEEYNKVNAEYTKNLALATVQSGVQLEKFVFVSSLAAIGPLSDLSSQIQVGSKPNPVTNYGSSKLLAEQYLLEIKGLPIVTIRPTAVYGPRERDIFILMQTINKGLELHIGKFKQHLSFIYVKDLAKIIVKALFSTVTNRSYNVSDGNVYDRYLLADGIKKSLQIKTFKLHLPVLAVAGLASFMELLFKRSKNVPALNKEKMNELTAINWSCNIDSAVNDLGYRPEFNLEEGLVETISWYKNNNWL